MNNFQEIANFIWSIADEVLRDDFKRDRAQANISQPILQNLELPCPPTGEQQGIVAAVRQVSEHFDVTISKIRRQISKFQEYRTALISAAVTGQIDVREAAEA